VNLFLLFSCELNNGYFASVLLVKGRTQVALRISDKVSLIGFICENAPKLRNSFDMGPTVVLLSLIWQYKFSRYS
jgi:hypothetical protein